MKKKILPIIISIFCIAAGSYGYYRYDQNKRAEAFQTAQENLVLSFKDDDTLLKELEEYIPVLNDNVLALEYGTEKFDTQKLIKDKNAETFDVEPKSVDLHVPGKYPVKYTISSHDEYGVEVIKEYDYEVDVVDTKIPSIEIARMWGYFMAGDEKDLTEYVVSVSDPVDGELPYSDTLTNGTYTFDRSEFIEDANGTYFITVCARDNNGNESYNGFKVTIIDGREQSQEEMDRLTAIREDYRQFDNDEDSDLRSLSNTSQTQNNLVPESLNGIWNSMEDENDMYLGFKVDYPKISEWGQYEASVRKVEGRDNEYEFVFEEDGDEDPVILIFVQEEEDSGSLYYTDDNGNRIKFQEVFKLSDDLTIPAQSTRRKARKKAEVAADMAIHKEVTRIEEETRKKQEDARKRAEQAAQAAQSGQPSSSSSSGNSSSVPSVQDVDISGFTSQVADIVNQERAAAGLGGLSMTGELNAAAQRRAEELVSYYSHNRPDGSSCFSVFDEFGISPGGAAENIAAGYSSPSAVMNAWMNSEGHRTNILNGDLGHIGVGCVYVPGSQYGYYWVQLFTD